MLKRFLATVMMVAGTSAYAAITTSVDMVDPTDGIAQPPAGVTCVDVFVDTTNAAGSAWTASGLRGVVTAAGQAAGVAILYDEADSNRPLIQAGLDAKFLTTLSKPRGRDANGRWTLAGSAIAGRYNPTGPIHTQTATEINVAYFASPPENAQSLGVDGYIARVALSTAGVPAGQTIGAGREAPAGATVIFQSVGAEAGVAGNVNAAFDAPAPTGINWSVWYVPEPASMALLGLGALAFIRRR